MTQPHHATSPSLGAQPQEPLTIVGEGSSTNNQSNSTSLQSTQAQRVPSQLPGTITEHTNSQHVNRETLFESPHPHGGTSSTMGAQTTPSAAVENPSSPHRGRASAEGGDYEIPDQWENVDELEPVSPVDGTPRYRRDLESLRHENSDRQAERDQDNLDDIKGSEIRTSKWATQLYTLSYLIFFSLLGTLARVGLTALTSYPGTPIIFATIWANTGGSFIMGFLAEDREVFRQEWGAPKTPDDEVKPGAESASESARMAAKKAHLAVKKTIPLYIGMATGFCGSMTSFSTFIRDAFLALSNNMTVPGASDLPRSRSGGYSFMAMLAVIIATVALSLSGLIAGAHFAIAMQPFLPHKSLGII